ncbi:MAG TPA: hypothetical protein VHY35_14905 [Stellaceae bacterium]|jgi:hypothetical protein|nr:hypothetical protein [Stellaceae bacterium]
MRQVYLCILPFAALAYFFCYLDRINIDFSALTMNKDLGLDPASYGPRILWYVPKQDVAAIGVPAE